MNAKQAKALSDKASDPEAVSREMKPLLKMCHNEIERAAKIGHESTKNPMDGLRQSISSEARVAVNKALTDEGFVISGNLIIWS